MRQNPGSVGAAMPSSAPSNAAYATFSVNLAGARNVVAAGRNLEGLGVTKVDIGDLYRGAWLQAVSALDTFMRAEILRRVETIAQSVGGVRPQELDRLRITVKEAEEIRLGTLTAAEVVVAAVAAELERATIQRPAAISKYLRYVSDHDVWEPVAAVMRATDPAWRSVGAGELRGRLDAVIERRNQIAHGADLLTDGSGGKRPIDAPSIDAAIILIAQFVLALDEVLGDPPGVAVEDDSGPGYSRRRNSVLLILEQEAIVDGTKLHFHPAPFMKDAIGDWLAADSARAVATWTTSGWPSMCWAYDGERYSPTGLIKKMYNLAGARVPPSIAGPSYWYVSGEGNLWEIADRIHGGSD